jgi:capsular polysaccharide biosynthesis protein
MPHQTQLTQIHPRFRGVSCVHYGHMLPPNTHLVVILSLLIISLWMFVSLDFLRKNYAHTRIYVRLLRFEKTNAEKKSRQNGCSNLKCFAEIENLPKIEPPPK